MIDGDALIHLRVPAATKAAWVRESRAAGMRLTDWIVNRVERPLQPARPIAIRIPADLPFSELRLSRTPAGDVDFDWRPIEAICAASGVDPALFRDADEDNVAGLIVQWYRAHMAAGGERDPVADDLIAEVQIEDAHGQHASHQPGRA